MISPPRLPCESSHLSHSHKSLWHLTWSSASCFWISPYIFLSEKSETCFHKTQLAVSIIYLILESLFHNKDKPSSIEWVCLMRLCALWTWRFSRPDRIKPWTTWSLRHSSEPNPLTSALSIQWNNLLAGSGSCKKEILSFILFFGACFSVYFLPPWRNCSWIKSTSLSHSPLWYEVLLSTATQRCRGL